MRPLIERLVNKLQQYEPDAPELQEPLCKQCGGRGAGWIQKDNKFGCPEHIAWYTCWYCGGKGSGRSEPYQKALEETMNRRNA